MYLAVACAVVLGFFFNIYTSETGSTLYDSNFDVLPNTYQPITRGTSENENLKAFEAYENGDFKTAEAEFEDILKTSTNPNIQFYYGLSLLNQSKFDLALEEFNKITDINYEYQAELLWYKALIHIKKEAYPKAKEYLEILNAQNANFKAKERNVLLKKLQ
jgi:tetratricopeptide (TPR) repeat protein